MQGTKVRSLVQKIPHAMEELSPQTTTIEPVQLESVLHNTKANAREARTPQPRVAVSLQLEKAHMQHQRSSATKYIF